jgi:Predicted hydrolase (HAD superfamily)
VTFDLSTALKSVVPGRPLVVTDADGVLLCFTGGLEKWLNARGLYLDLTTYRIEGAIRRLDDQSRILHVETMALIEEYRQDLDHLEAVDGAVDALNSLSKVASIIVLSNVNHRQAVARVRNFKALGLDYPLIANDTGGGYLADKGEAVRIMAGKAKAPTFFIDDIPSNLAAVAKAAPQAKLVHIVESEPLRTLLGQDFHAHIHAETWDEAKNFILKNLE